MKSPADGGLSAPAFRENRRWHPEAGLAGGRQFRIRRCPGRNPLPPSDDTRQPGSLNVHAEHIRFFGAFAEKHLSEMAPRGNTGPGDELFTLSDRIAIVTGGMGQLGLEYTRALVARGARVAVFDIAETPGQPNPDIDDAIARGKDLAAARRHNRFRAPFQVRSEQVVRSLRRSAYSRQQCRAGFAAGRATGGKRTLRELPRSLIRPA